MCGHDIVSELEVHHIHPRAENGSNDVRNLIVVCAKCHDATHAGKLHIGQLIQTSSGPERSSSTPSVASSVPSVTSSKWSGEEMDIIVNMLRTYKILPLKQLVFRLKVEHDIDISEQTLRKIRRDGA
jgi:hypothetical protein